MQSQSSLSARQQAAEWLALAFAERVGPKTFARLLAHFGSPHAVLASSRAELLRSGQVSQLIADSVPLARRSMAAYRAVVEQLIRRQVHPIRVVDEGYPASLRQLPDPPPVLLAQGGLELLGSRGVAVVGTTGPSARGAQIAGELAARLAAAGRSIVSGYARGIDTAAHLGALRAEGRTTLVIPTGHFQFHWRAAFRNFAGLDRHVLILSEQHPSEGWTTGHAIARNRLIVALSEAVVFVETLARPAAQETFRLARRLGKPVFVVKYRRAPASAAGNAALLRLGAIPVTSYADVAAILGARPTGRLAQSKFSW